MPASTRPRKSLVVVLLGAISFGPAKAAQLPCSVAPIAPTAVVAEAIYVAVVKGMGRPVTSEYEAKAEDKGDHWDVSEVVSAATIRAEQEKLARDKALADAREAEYRRTGVRPARGMVPIGPQRISIGGFWLEIDKCTGAAKAMAAK